MKLFWTEKGRNEDWIWLQIPNGWVGCEIIYDFYTFLKMSFLKWMLPPSLRSRSSMKGTATLFPEGQKETGNCFAGSHAFILKLLTWCSGCTFFFHNKSPKIEQTLKAWHLLQLSNPSWPKAEVGEVSTKSRDSAKTFFVCFCPPKCSARRQGSWLLLSCFQSSYIITARLQR